MSQDSVYLVFVGIGVSIMLIVALYLLLPALSALLRARDSQKWPSVQGVLEHAWVETREYTQSVSHNQRFRVSYFPQVRYRYTVAGQTYEGGRINIGAQVGSSKRDAERILAPYPPGSTVEVFYDPAAPENAVLERGINKTPVYAGLAMLALAVVLGMVLYAVR